MANKNILLRSKLKKADNLFKSGNLTESLAIYEQLAKKNPKNPEIILPLVVIYRRSGEFDKALTACKPILNSHPNHTQAIHLYGSVLQSMGNIENAIDAYKQALSIDPNLIETHYFLGNAYQQTGQLDSAEISFRNAINLNPNFFEALSNLGAVLVELHKTEDARETLLKADKMRPNCEQVLCNLGELMLIDNQLEKSIEYAKRTLNIAPNFLDALNLLGKIYSQRGDYDLSLKYYNKALAIEPENENIISNIAQIYERRQEFDLAKKIISSSLSKTIPSAAILLVYSSLSRHFREELKAIELLKSALKQNNSIAIKISIHSELGKQFDHLGKYHESFHHYHQANKLEKKLNLQFNNSNNKHITLETIAAWSETFDKAFWKSLRRSNNASQVPVFVIGMPRSGTSLTEQIIATHPNAYGAGELPDIGHIANKLGYSTKNEFNINVLENVSQNDLDELSDNYIKHICSLSINSQIVVNKMPTDFWYVGLITLLFPNAKIIHMIRNRLDTCVSMYFQRFGPTMTFTTDLRELVDYYISYEKIMEYWKSVLDIDMLDIHYEDLINEQESISRKIINFCGLEWSNNCLTFYDTKRDVNTPSYDQVRKPIYNNSIERWRNYEEDITTLIDRFKEMNYL